MSLKEHQKAKDPEFSWIADGKLLGTSKERYIPPENWQQITNELRLI